MVINISYQSIKKLTRIDLKDRLKTISFIREKKCNIIKYCTYADGKKE